MKFWIKWLVGVWLALWALIFGAAVHHAFASDLPCDDRECVQPTTSTQRHIERQPRHVSDVDEDARARATRLREIADAVDAVTRDRLERAMLLVLAQEESHYARYVDLDEPRCRDGHEGRCDNGRAWSVWQLWGTERTGTREDAARMALSRLRGGTRYCAEVAREGEAPDPVVSAFAIYGTGRVCDTASARHRAERARSVAKRI